MRTGEVKMKIRQLIAAAAVCAGVLLTGCDTFDYGITSASPREIEGFSGNVEDVQPNAGDLIAEFEIEGFGTIKAVLFPQAAPMGVENFQKLADSGYYDGLKIHRVVSDFMFQGGSANGDGTGGDAAINGGSFGIETAQNARHFYGALCYANDAGSNTTQFYIVNSKSSEDLSAFDYESYDSIVEEGKGYIKEAHEAGETNYEEYYVYQTQFYQNRIDYFKGATEAISNKYKTVGGVPSLDGNYTVFGQVYEGLDVVDAISAVEVQDNGGGEVSKPVEDIIIKSVKVTTFS